MIGGDSLKQFPTWRHPDKICEMATPLVVARPGEAAVDLGILATIASKDRYEYFQQFKLESPLIEISSSEIRRRCSEGQSFRYLTPRAVEKYLETQKMYLSNSQN